MRIDVSQKEKALTGYTFRIKLPLAKRAKLPIDSSAIEWSLGAGLPQLRLSSGSEDTPISQASVLYVTSDTWPDETSAAAAAAKYIGALAKAMACLRVGVDYGDRAPGGGGFSPWLIQKIWDEQGVRVINEQPGVMIYETDPRPIFSGSSGDASLVIHATEFEAVFKAALRDARPLTPHERVSIALYNAAFFEESQDARFLLNMMAVEALLDQKERSPAAISLIDQMVQLVHSSDSVVQSDKDSLCGALKQLKRESIGHAGRTLVAQLDGRKYAGSDAVAFFRHCYSLRSRLVHGDSELPSRDEVSNAAASLEVMVSDLLAGPLSEVRLAAASG